MESLCLPCVDACQLLRSVNDTTCTTTSSLQRWKTKHDVSVPAIAACCWHLVNRSAIGYSCSLMTTLRSWWFLPVRRIHRIAFTDSWAFLRFSLLIIFVTYNTAGIKFIHVTILRFFAPQRRLVWRIIVKFGTSEGTFAVYHNDNISQALALDHRGLRSPSLCHISHLCDYIWGLFSAKKH